MSSSSSSSICDYQYEAEVLQNPQNLKAWWRYLIARSSGGAAFEKRMVIYERALRALPGSYKLWFAYLRERLEMVRNLPITHRHYDTLNNTFERALATMHKMPRIWTMYLGSLTHQKLITRARRACDRALCALPLSQHGRIWERYLALVSEKGVPMETSLRVYRRYLMYDPTSIEDFIQFLISSNSISCAAEMLAGVLNDDGFQSVKGKTKHMLWLELCDLLTTRASEISISRLNVDAIIRGGVRKFTDEVGRLWTSLADYYIRRGLYDKARDVFEEGLSNVITVRDFSVVFDAYSQFEDSMLSVKLELEGGKGGGEEEDDNDEEDRLDVDKLMRSIDCFWLNDDDDVDLRLARLEHLMERRAELANSVVLRQNPHNVEQWHRRVKLFEGNATKQILTYAEAVRTVDPVKAVGKPHTLWLGFAALYESLGDLSNARLILDKAVQADYKAPEHLAAVWCEWAEMELRHKNFKAALQLMRRATAEPSLEVKRRVMAAADGCEPVQMKLHKSLMLWTFYVDLEESLGTLESTRTVYERILNLRIATPQIIINYAMLLEEHGYFEDSFQVYERGVKIFKYPHVKDIWLTYLSKFVARYGKLKLERARELFQSALEEAPASAKKPLYIQYAKMEEEFGLSKRAMLVYDEATKAVSPDDKLGIYEVYIARASDLFGVAKTRKIYDEAIESRLQDKDVEIMCLRYAELELKLGEIHRSRALYKHASQFSDPRSHSNFWSKWNEFEVHHGNEDTFREMLRIKRSVSASYSQLPEYLADGEMTVVRESRLLLPAATTNTNDESIELPPEIESESDGDDDKKKKVEVAESAKEVKDDVAETLRLVRKREDDIQTHYPGLEKTSRIKRMRKDTCG